MNSKERMTCGAVTESQRDTGPTCLLYFHDREFDANERLARYFGQPTRLRSKTTDDVSQSGAVSSRRRQADALERSRYDAKFSIAS